MSKSQCRIENTSREVIENQLLIALNDKSKVAVLCTRSDLRLFIDGLKALGTPQALEFAKDAEQLDLQAFGEPEIVCHGCKNAIDPNVCHCGDAREGHGSHHHQFCPMGCTCGYAKEDELEKPPL